MTCRSLLASPTTLKPSSHVFGDPASYDVPSIIYDTHHIDALSFDLTCIGLRAEHYDDIVRSTRPYEEVPWTPAESDMAASENGAGPAQGLGREMPQQDFKQIHPSTQAGSDSLLSSPQALIW